MESAVFDGFLLQTISLTIVAVLAFLFNARLQKRLLREQNKNKLLDDLLMSLDEQSNFYGRYWDPQNLRDSGMKTNDTMRLTRFYTMLSLAGEKYQLYGKNEMYRQCRVFIRACTDNFGFSADKDDIRVRQIHVVANELSAMLLENKS